MKRANFFKRVKLLKIRVEYFFELKGGAAPVPPPPHAKYANARNYFQVEEWRR